MSSEPPSKKSRRESSASYFLEQLSSTQADAAQPSTSATNPFQGNCRAYGGSDHLPLDLESHGFQLLDEANNDDDGNEGQYSDTDNESSLSSGDRVSQEEIHALLEQGVTAALGSNKQPVDKQAEAKQSGEGESTAANPKVIQKFLIADLDNLFNHFERLPEGWAQITHNSGLPVYLHRPTRVCTFGRPYFMGDGSVRKHDVPLSAIPCLHYRRIKGELEVQPNTLEPVTDGGAVAAEGEASEQSSADATTSKTSGWPIAPSTGPLEQAATKVASLSCPVSGAKANGASSNGAAPSSCPVSGAKTNGAASSSCPVSGAMTNGAAPSSYPVSGAKANGACPNGAAPSSCPVSGVKAANLSEALLNATVNSSAGQQSTDHRSQLTDETGLSKESCPPNKSAAIAIETNVPSNDKTDSNGALTSENNLQNRDQSTSVLDATAENSTLAKYSDSVTNGTTDAKGESNITNGTAGPDSNSRSNAKEGNANPSKPSSTFNTALATALNICPSQPPPKGAPPGSEEVQLEPLKLLTVDAENLRQYCSSRFKFQIVQKMRFNTWSEKRNYTKEQRRKNRPPMPEGTKLLSLKTRTYSVDDPRSHKKRNWVLNPKGKSYVCILHEYLQHVLNGQPAYVFKEVENASSPYAAAIFVNGFEYATGYGSSKRQAKCEAARSTLEILMPELVREIEENEGKKDKESDLEFFDSLRIEDPNVNELCSKMSELPPYSLLLNCIQRNYCLKSDSVKCHLITNNNQKNEFVMTVGKHTVQVPCKNKKEGKQKASQALLQKLHPHINSWGSMVRLYGNRSLELLKDKKKVEQEVTLLQNNATVNQPNYSILNLLKAEMLKLHRNKESVRPLGEFRPPEDIRLPTPSSSDLNTLDL